MQEKSERLQSLMLPSVEEEAKIWSDGENWTAHSPRRWPRKTPKSRRSELSHIFAVLSCEPVAISLSFGETQTELISFSCATAVCNTLNSAIGWSSPAPNKAGVVRQSFRHVSWLPLARKFSAVRLSATQPTDPVCAFPWATHLIPNGDRVINQILTELSYSEQINRLIRLARNR